MSDDDRLSERDLPLIVQHAITHRLRFASLHWGTEEVHPDAWPHVADAVADAILAAGWAPPERVREAERQGAERGWDEGRAIERNYMRRVMEYHHWSAISSGPPADPPNPYRADRLDWDGGA